jgi:nucleoside-diphosphate-sugar epimerase
MKILIIGGTGFISSVLVQFLLEKGHRVTLFNRGMSASPFHRVHGVDVVKGDRCVHGSLEQGLGRRRFDAVFDMVAYSGFESEYAATFFRGRTGRFIHCSSVSVYMVSDKVTCPITEDQSNARLMEFWTANPFGMEYGIRKRECEKILWDRHDEKLLPVSILRPTFVSGPADPARRDYFWMERIADGAPVLVPGTGEHLFQQVFVRDVARAFVGILDHPISVGKAYNVASEESSTLNEYLVALACLLGKEPRLVHIPIERFDALPLKTHPDGDVFPFNVRRNATFSLEAIRQDLGYHSTPFREWMQETVRWWMGSPRRHSTGYERRADEIRVVREWERKGSVRTHYQ